MLDKPALYLGEIRASSVHSQNKNVIANVKFIMCTIEEMEKRALGLQNSWIGHNQKQTKNHTPINQADEKSNYPKAIKSFKENNQKLALSITNLKTDSQTRSESKKVSSSALSTSLSVKPFKDFFIWGPYGSGKTLLGVLWVKQMIDAWTKNRDTSKLSVYIIAHLQEEPSTDQPKLISDFEHYFHGYAKSYDIHYISNKEEIEKQFPKMNTRRHSYSYKFLINEAGERTQKGGKKIILFVDEESWRSLDNNSLCDYSDVENNFLGLGVVVCVSPVRYVGHSKTGFKINPPHSPNFYSKKLTNKYRNTKEIQEFISFLHNIKGY